MVKCGCCGQEGKIRSGCSCSGGKSHRCLKTVSTDSSAVDAVVSTAAAAPPTWPTAFGLQKARLAELRKLIDDNGLQVSNQTGGTSRRILGDIRADVERANATLENDVSHLQQNRSRHDHAAILSTTGYTPAPAAATTSPQTSAAASVPKTQTAPRSCRTSEERGLDVESAGARSSSCESFASLPDENSTADTPCPAAGTTDSTAPTSWPSGFMQRIVQRFAAPLGGEMGDQQAGSLTSSDAPDNLGDMTISQLRDVIAQEKLPVDANVGLNRKKEDVISDIRKVRAAGCTSSSQKETHGQGAGCSRSGAFQQCTSDPNVSRTLVRNSGSEVHEAVDQELCSKGFRETECLQDIQREGVLWMLEKEQKEQGGILADDMGLGKTLQMLCVMALRPRPTLVICPLTAFMAWKADVSKFFVPDVFKVIDYHEIRQAKGSLPCELPENALVLINSESLRPDVCAKELRELPMELRRKNLFYALQEAGIEADPFVPLPQMEARARQKGLDFATLYRNRLAELNTRVIANTKQGTIVENPDSQLLQANFGRIVCDEAQILKNLMTKPALDNITSHACMRICHDKPCVRFCMTGTPMENAPTDLLSLLKFIRAEPYCQRRWFDQHIVPHQPTDAFQECFDNTVLRRTKAGVGHTPVKHLVMRQVCMSPEDQELEKTLLVEEEGNPALVHLLRSTQAAGNIATTRAKAKLQIPENCSLSDLQAIAQKPVSENGLGRKLVPPGDKSTEAARQWCVRQFTWERSWIEADKPKLLRSDKWQAVRDVLTSIWENGSAATSNVVDCALQPVDDPEAGVWEGNGTYAQSLDTNERTKVVFVSRFPTRTFELAEHLFKEMGVVYCRIDQTVPPKRREEIVTEFNNDPSIRVMLLGMKSGGVGINLQVAQVAILFDWWWNPASERQAMDRIHRMNSPHKHNYFFKFHVANNAGENKHRAVQSAKEDMRRGTIDLACNRSTGGS